MAKKKNNKKETTKPEKSKEQPQSQPQKPTKEPTETNQKEKSQISIPENPTTNESPSNPKVENFFSEKYTQFNNANKKISEIFNEKNKNPKNSLSEKNLGTIFTNLNQIYSLIKTNSNFFNFTKNILTKLEKENYFEEILLNIFHKISTNEIKIEKNFEEFSKKNLIFFLLILIKFKIKSRVNIFEFFGENKKNEEIFSLIFEELTNFPLRELEIFERELLISFLILCYQNLEIKFVANICLKYISFYLFVRLSPQTLKNLFIENEKFVEKWKILMKLDKKMKLNTQKPSFYFNDLLNDFLFLLEEENLKEIKIQKELNFLLEEIDNENENENKNEEKILEFVNDTYNKTNSFIFFEKFIEFLTDLISQISTRKLIIPFLKEKHFLERIKVTKFYINSGAKNSLIENSKNSIEAITTKNTSEFGRLIEQRSFNAFKLFTKMVDNLTSFIDFDFDENTHQNISYDKIIMKHYEEINKMQALAYNLFPEKISKFYLKCISTIDNRENLEILLDNLTDKELISFFSKLNLLNLFHFDEEFYLNHKQLLVEIFVNKYEKKNILLDKLMETPLYPNEELLFDNDLIPQNEKTFTDSVQDFMKLITQKNLQTINSKEDKTLTNEENATNNIEDVFMFTNEGDKISKNSEFYLKFLIKNLHKNSTSSNYFIEKPYPIPKLNLQFLTNFDYLYRNFTLFKFESSYEIRQDISDVIERIFPVFDEKGNLKDFDGWSRMAVPIKAFKVLSAKKPNIGKKFSEEIFADVEYSLGGIQSHIKSEWDKIKKHDILFLITFQLKKKERIFTQKEKNFEESCKKLKSENIENTQENFNTNNNTDHIKEIKDSNSNNDNDHKFGLEIVKHIRGCEVNFLYDNENNQLSELENIAKKKPIGIHRRIQVILDGVQYNKDLKASENNIEEIYSSFHLLVRRKPKENNFRAILETIRDLMNETTIIPPWLENNFLGFGDPTTSDYRKLNDLSKSQIDFYDTFLDNKHFEDTFMENNDIPNEFKIQVKNNQIPKFLKLDFKNNPNHVYEILKKIDRLDTIKLLNFNSNNNNLENQIRKNSIRFTSKQIEAIVSGMHHGLTTIIGPPGTGKTDIAVQLVSLIYHNFPNQRTLIVTHSNTALNDIFEKISKLDINERYLLRLGIGEKELFENLDKDFSRFGRINNMLEKRIELLNSVLNLAKSINVYTHEEYTCENAVLFYEFHVKSRIKEFKDKFRIKFGKDFDEEINNDNNNKDILSFLKESFPFNKYFAENLFKEFNTNENNVKNNITTEKNKEKNNLNTNTNIFELDNLQNALKKSNTLIEYIEAIFTEISEVRAFELLRNNIERGNYLLTKQAKVIAMTCTHAALKRREFIKLGFEYDNIIIEEAAQILEVETFIPLLLQNTDRYKQSRLKRVVLIGDDNQLPPIVKHATYKNYSKLDQSLFNRFVRTGSPYIKLDAQGRMRPIITDLFRWRYPNLKDLDIVKPKLPLALASDKEKINTISLEEFSAFNFCNPGFAHEFQFINIPKDNKMAYEYCPVPHFYQNLAEAEFIVAVFMYMCIQGYNPEKITILTTYNGQKALIKDIIKKKCAWNPIFKQPKKITTVDRYQGQQNDYVLLSLVRTKYTGYLRDIRRLVVSLSRAKLGLYVFGCWELFANCQELKETFGLFSKKPLSLMININENMFSWPNLRKFADNNTNNVDVDLNKKLTEIKIMDFMHMFNIVNELMKIRSSYNMQGQGQAFISK